MPSYAAKLSAQDLTDLVRYFSSWKGFGAPNEKRTKDAYV
jgi:hypothetical protein